MTTTGYSVGRMLVEHLVMPKSRKRKRKHSSGSSQLTRGRRHSSSSQSSCDRHSLGAHRTIIAISRKPSAQPENTAKEMANALGSELKPEHKLPKKEIWVQPKPQFLDLLYSVGASGSTFTAKEVLSYLIKYISSRQLYDPKDPKKVFCKSDPLGQVFNVPSFTIKDAKRLLFENMTVLHNPPEVPSIPRVHSLPQAGKDCYITFRNNQENRLELPPSAPFPLPQPYGLPSRIGCGGNPSVRVTASQSLGRARMSTGVDMADGLSKHGVNFKPLGVMLGPLEKEGGTDEPDVGVTPPLNSQPCSEDNRQGGSVSESTRSVGVVKARRVQRRKKHPKRRHNEAFSNRKSRSRSESSSHTLTSHASRMSSQRSSKRSSKRSSRSTKWSTKMRSSYRGDTDGGRSQKDRPWYCILYQAEEEVKSQSSEIWSVQGKETAVVTDTSDDLWFMDDDRFSLEYEVASDSSEAMSTGTSSISSTDAEIFVEVEDLGSSSDSRFADEDTTDSEIPEEDKWKCSECGLINNPVHGYCSFCWARRMGWLADEDRKNPSERLGDKHILRRAFSAPAGCHQDTVIQTMSCGRVRTPTAHYSWTNDEAGIGGINRFDACTSGHHSPCQILGRLASHQDFADGKSDDEAENVGDVPQERGHVLSPMAVFSPTPIRTLHGIRNDITALSSVPEAAEEAGVQCGSEQCVDQSNHTSSGNEDHGVGSDPSQHALGTADTVSRHSSDSKSSGVIGGLDSAGCQRPKREVVSVNREDSGVCMKRQSSGLSEVESSQQPSYDTHALNLIPVISVDKGNTHSVGLFSTHQHSGASGRPSGISQHVAAGTHLKASCTEGSQHVAEESLAGETRLEIDVPGMSKTAGAPASRLAARSPFQVVATSRKGTAGGVVIQGQELCRVCCTRPKTASIIHGRTGHQVCCYRCAKKLRRRGKPCPVCRRPIQHIVKNFFA